MGHLLNVPAGHFANRTSRSGRNRTARPHSTGGSLNGARRFSGSLKLRIDSVLVGSFGIDAHAKRRERAFDIVPERPWRVRRCPGKLGVTEGHLRIKKKQDREIEHVNGTPTCLRMGIKEI